MTMSDPHPAGGHVPPEHATPTVLVPGLLTSARLYAGQIPALWRFGPVTVADNTQGETMADLAHAILADAPPRFALAGLSMGGYIAFEIMRQAPHRVTRLALLDTSALPDRPEQTERRLAQIAKAEAGLLDEVADEQIPFLFLPANQDPMRAPYHQMAHEVGTAAFIRQQRAIISRPDSRPDLPKITCPALVLVGEGDVLTPPERAAEIAGAIPGARLQVLPGCAHLSALEQPAAVASALQEWLAAT